MKLRKVSKIIILIEGILAIIGAVAGFFFFLAFVIAGPVLMMNTDALVEAVPQLDGLVAVLGGSLIAVGVLCLFDAILSLVLAVVCLKTRKNLQKKPLIGIIILSVLAGFEIIGLVGAILGLIAIKKCPVEEEPVEEVEEVEAE